MRKKPAMQTKLAMQTKPGIRIANKTEPTAEGADFADFFGYFSNRYSYTGNLLS